VADNFFEQPKTKEKAAADLKLDLTIVDQGESAKEPLSLLSLAGIDARKAITRAKNPAEEILTASPVSRLHAEQDKKPELLSVGRQGDSLKSIYEDGILKLYDEPGKSHFGFKFLETGGVQKEHLSAGAARKEKLEDLIKGIAFEVRFKF
jgi:hypothetical protein